MPEEAMGQESVSPGAEAPVGGDSADYGQATTDTATTIVEPQRFDWQPYADHHVAINRNGAEELVPLKDVVSQHMMQRDYTQKTQALAEQQRALDTWQKIAQAYELDPGRTIEYLQEQAGLMGGEVEPEEQEFLTEEQQRLQELEQWRQQEEQRVIEQQIQAEIDELSPHMERFGVAPDAVIQHAIQNDLPNLRVALSDMVFPRAVAETAALQDFRQQREQQGQQLGQQNAQNARAASVVAGGHGVQGGAVQPGGQRVTTAREAYQLAKQQLGY